MPDQHGGNGFAIRPLTTTQIVPPEQQVAGDETGQSLPVGEPNISRRSSEDSDDVPFPFESDSASNEEAAILGGTSWITTDIRSALTNPAVRVKTWRTLLRRIFHMPSGYRDGYGDDVRIASIIESRI